MTKPMIRRYLVLLAWLAAGPSPVLAQKLGPEFQVNTETTNTQGFPAVASDANGNFVVVWEGDGPGSSASGTTTMGTASEGSSP